MSAPARWDRLRRRQSTQGAGLALARRRALREVAWAARGGRDPARNPELECALYCAHLLGLGQAECAGALSGDARLEECRFEAYGPGEVSIVVRALASQPAEAAGAVSAVCAKHAATLAPNGSLDHRFATRGILCVPAGSASEDTLLSVALDAGALEVDARDPAEYEILTPIEALPAVRAALEAHGVRPAACFVGHAATEFLTLIPEETGDATALLLALDALDCVQQVACDLEIPEQVSADEAS